MFTVYSKTNCSYCQLVDKLFKAKNIEYKKLLLNVDFSKEDFLEKFGPGTTFPQVFYNDSHIGGAKQVAHFVKTFDVL